MHQQLQRQGSMEPLNDQQQQQGGHNLDLNLIRQKNCIIGLTCFCFLFCTIYLQALCMIPGVQVCSMNGVEAPKPFQQSIIAYYFFTLVFLYIIYYALENVKHTFVLLIRWPILLYALAAIIIGVVAIITSYSLTTSDLQETWNKITQWRKQSYYDSNQTNLLNENKRNLILISVYHFIYGFVFLILFGLLFNYQTIMPQNWRPPFSSRLIRKTPLIYKSDQQDQRDEDKLDDEQPEQKQDQNIQFNQQQKQSDIQQNQSQRDEQPSTIFQQQQQKKKQGKRFGGKQVQNQQQQQQQQQQQSQLQQSNLVQSEVQDQGKKDQQAMPF